MTSPAARGALLRRIAGSAARDVPPQVAALAEALAQEAGAVAVLFYGSNLRTGALDGVIDFYLLTAGAPERGIWPRVRYHEVPIAGQLLRAKTATMTLATFARAARGRTLDTTIWARFVQPAALVLARGEEVRGAVLAALADAAVTAARLAAALGPARGPEADYWAALFRATYTAEFRVERPGRERAILDAAPAHFAGLLAAAWTAGGIAHAQDGDDLVPKLDEDRRARTLRWWRRRRSVGKSLNLLRLVRATTTFDGAARYAAWKVERHTGVKVPVTARHERHPLLAAPRLLRALWRGRRLRGNAG